MDTCRRNRDKEKILKEAREGGKTPYTLKKNKNYSGLLFRNHAKSKEKYLMI